MPTYEFPSSLPSTPGSSKQPALNFFDQHPTTTPAGPPPSSIFDDHPSTTPAGPPPSQGKSFAPTGLPMSLFGKKDSHKKSPLSFGSGKEKQFQTQTHTQKIRLNDATSEDGDADGEMDMEVEELDLPRHNNNSDFDDAYDWNAHGESTRQLAGKSPFRNSNRAIMASQTPFSGSMIRGNESALSAAARNLVTKMGNPELDESDDLIVQTEMQVSKMYNENAPTKEQEEILTRALKIVPESLIKVWKSCCDEIDHSTDEERGEGVGPLDQDPALFKAAWVGSLLLLLNHPPARILQSQTNLRMSISNKAVAIATTQAYPETLIDWLDRNHNPFRSSIPRLVNYKPNPAAHANYWDMLLSQMLRGQVGVVAELLANANMSQAHSAKDDGNPTKGYKDAQLQIASQVIGRAAARLKACPGLRGDWDVTGNDWANWRSGVEEELGELIRRAEGDREANEFRSSFEAENFGISTRSQTLSMSTRRAQSKVPWTVYQSLKSLYNIVLCEVDEIITLAGDWLEATMALAIWWNGSDNTDLTSSTTSFRQSGNKQSSRTRMVDVDTVKAYRHRLIESFDAVTQEDSLHVDSTNPVEVAVACIMEGNIQDVFTILRLWSVPITAACMEVGTEAQWYESVHAESAPDLFDESDLMVLSYAKPEQPISKDSVLVEYMKLLLNRPPLQHGDQQIESWEIAVELIGRIDNLNLGMRTAQEVIKGIAITDNNRADRVISICKQYDLYTEAAEIAEKYGDTIPETSGSYGAALVFYARAHNTRKVKNVLDLLISYCLVQSVAFPATDKLDSYLSGLLHKPKESLSVLAKEDTQAAEILSMHFSGYATIRKFYEIRDGTDNRSLNTRRKAAMLTLLTAIQSAADNIQGGLYDADSPAVIPVDGLLALLGEASVFVNAKPRLLTLEQLLVLLRAIEDLDAVHPRIKAQCAEFFSSTLAAAHGAQQPDPKELLQKSVSNLTASSALSQSTGFSLLGNSIMSSGPTSGIGSSYADVAVSGMNAGNDNQKRTWDWRQNWRRDATPGRLIKKLRLGLAEEVGLAWIEEGV